MGPGVRRDDIEWVARHIRLAHIVMAGIKSGHDDVVK